MNMNLNFWKYFKLFIIALLSGTVLFILNSISKKREVSNLFPLFVNGAKADAPISVGAESGCDSSSESAGGAESGGSSESGAESSGSGCGESAEDSQANSAKFS